MMKIALGAAIALVATVATPAFAADAFVLDGMTYTYETTPQADGGYALDGTVQNGTKFHYVVRNGKVTGDVDGAPVSFSADAADGAARSARWIKAAKSK